MTITTNQIIIIIVDAELALEIQRELEQDREDQFVLEQIELDQHKQEDWSGDKKVQTMQIVLRLSSFVDKQMLTVLLLLWLLLQMSLLLVLLP